MGTYRISSRLADLGPDSRGIREIALAEVRDERFASMGYCIYGCGVILGDYMGWVEMRRSK